VNKLISLKLSWHIVHFDMLQILIHIIFWKIVQRSFLNPNKYSGTIVNPKIYTIVRYIKELVRLSFNWRKHLSSPFDTNHFSPIYLRAQVFFHLGTNNAACHEMALTCLLKVPIWSPPKMNTSADVSKSSTITVVFTLWILNFNRC
jgi:hypothetical protein